MSEADREERIRERYRNATGVGLMLMWDDDVIRDIEARRRRAAAAAGGEVGDLGEYSPCPRECAAASSPFCFCYQLRKNSPTSPNSPESRKDEPI